MADIQPFRGLRYDLQRIGDLSAVITPPYDVISAEEQRRYHLSSFYNIIRLDYGEERPADTDKDNRYSRAAASMSAWLEEGVLQRDGRQSIYLVEHRFEGDGRQRSRFSMIARVRLEELGSGRVLPHEMTMKGPSEDRLRLLHPPEHEYFSVLRRKLRWSEQP